LGAATAIGSVNAARNTTAALRALRDAFGVFPTGVAVVTTCSTTGAAVGVTVNSFASLSLDPPLVVWSLNRVSPSLAAFERSSHFAINVLSVDQVDLSRRFGSRTPDKFVGLTLTQGAGGVPLLQGAAAHFECRVEAVHPGGDHVLFVGHVERFAHDSTRAPLLFYAGRYRAPGGEVS
jgi:flavin reductase (DIM6/NTAB) family NADH-FMN oxidoreductase RutF